MHKQNLKGVVTPHTTNRGTSDPFTARMYFGILDISDKVFAQEEKKKKLFRDLYYPVVHNLEEARYAKDSFLKIKSEHCSKLAAGEICRVENNYLHIEENVDLDLNMNFKDFFIRGLIAIDCLKRLAAKIFGKKKNVEFIFGTDKNFEIGCNRFIKDHGSDEETIKLVDMLKDERKAWFSDFSEMRRKIEHEGYQFPKLKYSLEDDGAKADMIQWDKEITIPDALEIMWNNLSEFCEDLLIILLKDSLNKDILQIFYIKEQDRDEYMSLKYKIGPSASFIRSFEAHLKSAT